MSSVPFDAVFVFGGVGDTTNYGGILANFATLARVKDSGREKAEADLFVLVWRGTTPGDFHAVYAVFCGFFGAVRTLPATSKVRGEEFAKGDFGGGGDIGTRRGVASDNKYSQSAGHNSGAFTC